jgi:hypothetical protein
MGMAGTPRLPWSKWFRVLLTERLRKSIQADLPGKVMGQYTASPYLQDILTVHPAGEICAVPVEQFVRRISPIKDMQRQFLRHNQR